MNTGDFVAPCQGTGKYVYQRRANIEVELDTQLLGSWVKRFMRGSQDLSAKMECDPP